MALVEVDIDEDAARPIPNDSTWGVVLYLAEVSSQVGVEDETLMRRADCVSSDLNSNQTETINSLDLYGPPLSKLNPTHL